MCEVEIYTGIRPPGRRANSKEYQHAEFTGHQT